MMSLPITLRQLEIFLAVVRAGNVTRAAAELHLTQSATSMALAQLATQLKTVLFERVGRSLQLSERGRLLVEEAQTMLEHAANLPGVLSGQGAALRGELRLAASTTVGRYLLAQAAASFAAMHPAVQVHCVISNTEEAIEALRAHRVDAAYVEGHVGQADLDIRLWRQDRLAIFVAANHPRARARRLSIANLHRIEWIMREAGSGTRQLFDHAVHAARLPAVQPLLTLDDSEAVKQAVMQGCGAGCLSYLAIAAEVKARRLVVLGAPFLNLQRSLYRMTRRKPVNNPLQIAFQTHLDGSLSRA